MCVEPQTFFLIFLLFTFIAGAIVIFFGILARIVKTPNQAYEQAKKESLQDNALEGSVKDFKNHIKNQHQCLKCGSKDHEFKEFNRDFWEAFCLKCGYKEFYHLDLVSGLFRKKDIAFRENPPAIKSNLTDEELKEIRYYTKEYIGEVTSFQCMKCSYSPGHKFHLSFDSSYKFGGYGEVKRFSFTIFSCPKCGYTLFFDKRNPELSGALNPS